MVSQSFGSVLKHWRTARRRSQQALADEAEVSARHLSFLETGKARPSREMVLVLASALDVPLRARNAMLQSAGFAAAYRETDWGSPDLAQVRQVVEFLLRQAEPYGAVVVNQTWEVLRYNRPMELLLTWLIGQAPVGGNLILALFDPGLLRPFVANFDEIATGTLARLRHEAATSGDPALATEAQVRAMAAALG